MSRFFRQAADSDSESSDSEESLLSSDEDASQAKPAAPAKPAMSRFLRTANASDSSSSSSESESEDEDESDDDGEAHKEAKPKSRFLRDSDEEESDEEVKRVVKSARDKRLEEMEATGRTMDNALKINDWIAISSGVYPFHVPMYSARCLHALSARI
jgi:translation initiation factor 3 subunit C